MYISAFVAGSKLPNAYAEKAFSTINFRPLTFDSPSKGQCMYGYVFRANLGMDLESGYEFVLLKSHYFLKNFRIQIAPDTKIQNVVSFGSFNLRKTEHELSME